MTLTIIKYHWSDDKSYSHDNGQAKMIVDAIPPAFGDVLDKQKIRDLEADMGITFDKQRALQL